MSAKVFSRDFAQGKVKKLKRMKQLLADHLSAGPSPSRVGPLGGQRRTRSGKRGGQVKQTVQIDPRNPVVYAMAHRAASAGAGKHIRTQGATRRAEKVALQKLVRQLEQ